MKYQSIFNRLRRIEGQIRGIEEMVANDKEEREILIQLEAVKSAVSSTTVALVEQMIKEDDSSGSKSLDKSNLDVILHLLKK